MATIKKIILLAFVALLMTGCDETNEPKVIKHVNGFGVVVVDSCEYIYEYMQSTGGGYAVMTHKGNCRFCKERRQKELKELVKQLKEK